MHWAPDCEAYVTPVGPRQVGVAFLATGAPLRFDDALARFPALAARLGPPASTPRGAGPFEQPTRRRTAGRSLLVGDAAGYLDPLTGEGLRLGLAMAQAAVACARVDRADLYEAAWRRITRRYFLLTDALLRVSRPPALRRLIVPVCRRAPWLFRGAVDALAS